MFAAKLHSFEYSFRLGLRIVSHRVSAAIPTLLLANRCS